MEYTQVSGHNRVQREDTLTAENYDRKLELNGGYLLGIIGSINEDEVRPFREKHGLTHIDPNQWYPVDQVVAFIDDLNNSEDGMFNLIAVGMNIAAHIDFPPKVKTIHDVMRVSEQMHKQGWRNGDPGTHHVELVGERSARFTFERLPLPADFFYGLCYGLLKRFAPADASFQVTSAVDGSRYVYQLEW